MKKLIVSSMIVALLGVFALSGFAETTTTVTNRGETIVTKTLGNVATDAAKKSEFQDYSVYPGKPGEVGRIVRFYDFDSQGGAAGTIRLLPAVALENNLIIRDGYIKCMEAIVPQTGSTNSIELGDAEVLATATNTLIAADAIYDVVPANTAATMLQTTNATSYVEYVIEGAAVTNGKFMVVLDVELAP